MRELPFLAGPDDDGGSGAAGAFEVVDTLRFWTLERLEGALGPAAGCRAFAGERSAIAEFGLDGSLPAALSLFCSAMCSLKALRLAAPLGLAVAAVEVCVACR